MKTKKNVLLIFSILNGPGIMLLDISIDTNTGGKLKKKETGHYDFQVQD